MYNLPRCMSVSTAISNLACSSGLRFGVNNLELVPGTCWRIAAIIGTFCATLLTEYLVVYLLLGRPTRARARLFLVILAVNAVANPYAQLLLPIVLPLDIPVHVLTVSRVLEHWLAVAVSTEWRTTLEMVARLGVVQLMVLGVQFLVFVWLFGSMSHQGILCKPVGPTRTLAIVVAAKLASIAFAGIGIYLSAEVSWMWASWQVMHQQW